MTVDEWVVAGGWKPRGEETPWLEVLRQTHVSQLDVGVGVGYKL